MTSKTGQTLGALWEDTVRFMPSGCIIMSVCYIHVYMNGSLVSLALNLASSRLNQTKPNYPGCLASCSPLKNCWRRSFSRRDGPAKAPGRASLSPLLAIFGAI